MQPITTKILRNGSLVGVTVASEGIDDPISLRGLYHPKYIESLTNAGVKYFDYDPMHVKIPTSNGEYITIDQLPECKEEFPNSFWRLVTAMDAECYTPAEAARYYSISAESTITFAKGNYTINTREELLTYLHTIEQGIKQFGYSPDHRPLNSFVNPECVPNMFEATSSSENAFIFDTIARRRTFRDYDDFMSLVNWLEQNVPDYKFDPTNPITFVNAYNYWGIDGVSDTCLNISLQLDVQNNEQTFKTVSATNPYVNRTLRTCLMDAKSMFYSEGITSDLNSVETFTNQAILPDSEGTLFELQRSEFQKPYKFVQGYVREAYTYYDYKFIHKDGFSYIVRTGFNGFLAFFNGSARASYPGFNFFVSSVGNLLPLSKAYTRESYNIWLKCYIWAAYLSSRAIKKPKYNSTMEIYNASGISPVTATRAIADDLADIEFPANQEVVDSLTAAKGNLRDMLNYYLAPIPEDYYALFDVSSDCTEKDDFINAISYEKINEINMQAKVDLQCRDAAIWFDNVKTCNSVLFEGLQINGLGSGMMADGSSEFISAASALYTLYNIDHMFQQAGFNYLIDTSLAKVDINTLFIPKTKAAIGCLDDLANLWDRRCSRSGVWCYVTKVFAEISNQPLKDRRHYAMELITMSSKSLRDTLVSFIDNAIVETEMNEYTKTYLRAQKGKFAAALCFSILGARDTLTSGESYTQTITSGSTSFDVVVPSYIIEMVLNTEFKMQYTTLFDYIRYEYTGAYNFYCVNAEITPWRVIPVSGNLKLYNFSINYNDEGANIIVPEQYRNLISEGKIHYCLKDAFWKDYLIGIDDRSLVDDPHLYAGSLEDMLSKDFFESFDWYVARWFETIRKCKEQDKFVVRMPLQSDIVYSALASYYGEDVEPIYEDGFRKAPTWLCDMTPITVADTSVKKLTTNGSVAQMSFYALEDYELNDSLKFLMTPQNPELLVYVFGATISVIIKGKHQHQTFSALSLISNEAGRKGLAGIGVLHEISENKFIVKADNGFYLVKGE